MADFLGKLNTFRQKTYLNQQWIVGKLVKQAEAEVVPSSSLVEVGDEVEVAVEVEVGVEVWV